MNDTKQSRRMPYIPAGQTHEPGPSPLSKSTHRNYDAQWRRFAEWAAHRDIPHTPPVEPDVVVRYIVDRYSDRLPPLPHGRPSQATPGTLRVALAAIAYIHRRLDLPDPCKSPQVRSSMRRITRDHLSGQQQASPIDRAAFDIIRENAMKPRRRGASGHEGSATALERGLFDIALIGVMRDGMLRVSETVNLTWDDVAELEDGSGKISLPYSKTAPGGTHCWLTPKTMGDLDMLRGYTGDSGLVFNMSGHRISARIRRAAAEAGLKGRYNGHSPRIGMANDLIAAGVTLHEIQQAGRWRNIQMPAVYIRSLNIHQLLQRNRPMTAEVSPEPGFPRTVEPRDGTRSVIDDAHAMIRRP